MTQWTFFCLVVHATTTSLNVAFYAAYGEPVNLGAAVFCGLLFIVSLATWYR